MAAPEQGERAVGGDVVAVLAVVEPVALGALAEHAAVAVEAGEHHVLLRPFPQGGGLELPAAGELVAELGEDALVGLLPVVEIVGGVGRTAQAGKKAAVRIGRMAGDEAVVVDVAVVEAQRCHRRRRQVGLDDGVQLLVAVVGGVVELLAVLRRGHGAAAQRAGGVERAADVGGAAQVLPAAGAQRDAGLVFRGRPLAHQVDRRRRRAGAGGQPGGAAHHLDPVVDVERVVVGIEGAVGAGAGRQAVDQQVGDGKAAGEEAARFAAVVTLLHDQAGDVVDRVVEAEQILLLDLAPAEDADRLRRLARRQAQFGRRAHRAGGVGAAVFGGPAEAAGGHRHRRQGRLAGAGRWQAAQAVLAAAVAHRFQAAAGEQSAQALGDAVLAAQAGALPAAGQFGIDRDLDAGLAAEAAQGLVEAAGGDVETDRGAGFGGVGLGGQQAGAGGSAEEDDEQRLRDGRQRVAGEQCGAGHAAFPLRRD